MAWFAWRDREAHASLKDLSERLSNLSRLLTTKRVPQFYSFSMETSISCWLEGEIRRIADDVFQRGTAMGRLIEATKGWPHTYRAAAEKELHHWKLHPTVFEPHLRSWGAACDYVLARHRKIMESEVPCAAKRAGRKGAKR